jgi:hypothetical protein
MPAQPVYVWDGAQPVPARDTYVVVAGSPTRADTLQAVPYGYPSWAGMLDGDEPFLVAERFGGWSTACLHGYTQTVAAGAGAFTVPLHRTSDGVWIGWRQPSAPQTPWPDPSTTVWAELRNLRIDPPEDANVPPQPYMRVEELAETYGSTHVFFVDTRHAPHLSGELLQHLAQLMPGSRIVMEHPGGTGEPLTAAKGDGVALYKQLGEDPFAELRDGADRFDFLGVRHDAAEGIWTETLSHGKPVIGYGCESWADTMDAFSKGAAGVIAPQSATSPPPAPVGA